MMVMVRRSEAAMSISMSRKVQKQLVVGGDLQIQQSQLRPKLRISMDSYGFLWVSMDSLWIPMDFYGFLQSQLDRSL